MKDATNVTDKLLLSLIRPSAGIMEIQELLSDRTDWKDFQERAYAHRIAPLVYWNLKKLNLLATFPKPVSRNLEMAFVYTSRINIMIGEELKKIIKIFNEREISFIILKGHAFIETIYNKNPGIRPLKDTDLLLRKDDVKNAFSVLNEMGYELYEGYQAEAWYWNRHFHLPFQKKGKNTTFHVEIHWHLIEPDIPVKFDIEAFRNRAVEIDYLGAKANILHSEDALLYLIWHSAHNDFDELLSLADLLYLIDYHNPSWNKFISRIKTAQLDAPLFWASYITSELFNSNLIPTPEIDSLSKIFTKVFFTKKNVLEQYILSDWPFHSLVRIFRHKSKWYGIKRIYNNLPAFPRNLKAIVHYIYCMMRIWFRYASNRKEG